MNSIMMYYDKKDIETFWTIKSARKIKFQTLSAITQEPES